MSVNSTTIEMSSIPPLEMLSQISHDISLLLGWIFCIGLDVGDVGLNNVTLVCTRWYKTCSKQLEHKTSSTVFVNPYLCFGISVNATTSMPFIVLFICKSIAKAEK